MPSLKVMQKPSAPSGVTLEPVSASQLSLHWTDTSDNGSPISEYKVEWYSVDAQRETVTVTVSNTVDDTAGWFKLNQAGVSSTRIPFDATSAEFMKATIENVKTIVSSVTVTRSDPVNNGFVWTITFNAPGDQVDMTIDSHSGILGTNPSVSLSIVDGVEPGEYGKYILSNDDSRCGATLDSIQQGVCSAGVREKQSIVTSADSDITGTFVLMFRGVKSSAIPHDVTAANLKVILEGMSSVGTGKLKSKSNKKL